MSPVPYQVYDAIFGVTAFVVGAIVGSFLNVCVYRLPLGMSVNEPRRSFCPHCKAQLAWHENIPIFGWLFLRGRCAHCKAPIAARYPLVELLTALLFFFVYYRFREEWMLVLPYWIFTGLVIVATFIDFDHFIIPDEITIGGTVAGVLLSVVVPAMMGARARRCTEGCGRCSGRRWDILLCGAWSREANSRLAASASCCRRRRISSGGAARMARTPRW